MGVNHIIQDIAREDRNPLSSRLAGTGARDQTGSLSVSSDSGASQIAEKEVGNFSDSQKMGSH